MPTSKKKSRARAKPRRPLHRDESDHHLVRNRGFWWVCCSINATPRTKEKLAFSLRTKNPAVARARRDFFLRGLHAEGLQVRMRQKVDLGPVVSPNAVRSLVPWERRVAETLVAMVIRVADPDATLPAARVRAKRRRRTAKVRTN